METNKAKPSKKKKKKRQLTYSGCYVCIHCGRIIRAGAGRMREHLIIRHSITSSENFSKHYVSTAVAAERNLFPNKDKDSLNAPVKSSRKALKNSICKSKDTGNDNSDYEPIRAHIIYVPFGGMNKRW